MNQYFINNKYETLSEISTNLKKIGHVEILPLSRKKLLNISSFFPPQLCEVEEKVLGIRSTEIPVFLLLLTSCGTQVRLFYFSGPSPEIKDYNSYLLGPLLGVCGENQREQALLYVTRKGMWNLWYITWKCAQELEPHSPPL